MCNDDSHSRSKRLRFLLGIWCSRVHERPLLHLPATEQSFHLCARSELLLSHLWKVSLFYVCLLFHPFFPLTAVPQFFLMFTCCSGCGGGSPAGAWKYWVSRGLVTSQVIIQVLKRLNFYTSNSVLRTPYLPATIIFPTARILVLIPCTQLLLVLVNAWWVFIIPGGPRFF